MLKLNQINFKLKYFLLFTFFFATHLSFASLSQTGFVVIPLGVNGGILEDNLSAYLLAEKGSQDFILLDAGTIMSSLVKTETQKSLNQLGFKALNPHALAENFLKNNIKAYLISHAHLDHIAGLVLASPDDTQKNIFGTRRTLHHLEEYVFNWEIWPNFADSGVTPLLKQYHYIQLPIGQRIRIEPTKMSVEAMNLSHGRNCLSTAFLIHSEKASILYFGDTGADQLENSNNIQVIWNRIAPLIQSRELKAIFIEVSYPNDHSDGQLFGHLNPKWLLTELNQLAKTIDSEKALKDFPIVVTHIKPGELNGTPHAEIISQELSTGNHLGLQFIIPKQGQLLEF